MELYSCVMVCEAMEGDVRKCAYIYSKLMVVGRSVIKIHFECLNFTAGMRGFVINPKIL